MIGFIGAGAMGGAIIRGAIASGNFSADDVVVAIGDLDVTAELQCGSGPVEDEVDVAPGAEGDPARSPGRRLDRDLGA